MNQEVRPYGDGERNVRQKAFYESRASAAGGVESEANWITNIWTMLRRKMLDIDRSFGLMGRVYEIHKEWLGDLSGKRVLDLGCFSGNILSLYIAHKSQEYVGIDLSETAVSELNDKLGSISSAKAIAGDFYDAGFKDDYFDVIYAHSVLHHFENFDYLCKALNRILKDGGFVISVDPLQTALFNKVVRKLYRPFQSDKDWEWPFTKQNFEIIKKYFSIDRIQGFRGFSKIGYLCPPLAGWGIRMDERHASRFGWALWSCWLVTMRFGKRVR